MQLAGIQELRFGNGSSITPGLALTMGMAWPLRNVVLMVSAEDQKRADERIPHLLATPAAVRGISAEPLLGPLNLSRYMPAWFCDDCGAFMLGRGDDGCEPDEDESSPCCSTCGSLRVRAVGIDWVIPGGESGAGATPCELDWIEDLIRQCVDAGVAPFVKQLGSAWAKANGVDKIDAPGASKGGAAHVWPGRLRVRKFPKGAQT